MGFYLGIDLGTSYFKAGLFDEKCTLSGLGRKFLRKETGGSLICELPVPVFWDTLQSCVNEAIKNAGISPENIKAVSYSSQANSFILLGNEDKPLTPLILWPDKRAGEIEVNLDELNDDEKFLDKTGIGIKLSEEFCIAKISWFQKKQPALWKQVKKIMSISDYLTFMLTGTQYSDLSSSSLTGLLDITGCRWWTRSLEMFSLSPGLFPIPQRTGTHAGSLTKTGAELAGLTPGIPYYLGGLDHHCAAIGSGLLQNNYMSESTGTVLACVSYLHNYSPKKNSCTAPGLESGSYFQMALHDNGASTLAWYQKEFAPELSIPELLDMAGNVEKGCNGLIARPFVNRYKGLDGFENVRDFHAHGHYVRAILESTARSLAGLTELIKEPSLDAGIISTGGGARSKLWVEIKADMLNTVFFIPECSETACMGAAMIGAYGTGELGTWPELTSNWVRFKDVVTPDAD